jgi:hypothetical protein
LIEHGELFFAPEYIHTSYLMYVAAAAAASAAHGRRVALLDQSSP